MPSPLQTKKPLSLPVVVVLDFESDVRSEDMPTTLKQLAELTRTRLAQSGRFQVIDRGTQEKILKEQAEILKDCYDDNCRVQIGRLLSAEKLLAGNLLRFGQDCTLALRLFGLEKGTVEKSATETGQCLEEVYPRMVSKLVYKISFEDEIGEEALRKAMEIPKAPETPEAPPSPADTKKTFGKILLGAGILVLVGSVVGGGIAMSRGGEGLLGGYILLFIGGGAGGGMIAGGVSMLK